MYFTTKCTSQLGSLKVFKSNQDFWESHHSTVFELNVNQLFYVFINKKFHPVWLEHHLYIESIQTHLRFLSYEIIIFTSKILESIFVEYRTNFCKR